MDAQQYSDIPAGYKVLPPAAPPPPAYSDIPDGYRLLPPVTKPSPAIPPPPPPTMQQSDAAIQRTIQPRSPAPTAPGSASLSIGAAPFKRSVAEGLATEQQERRGGMPLSIQPANYGLEGERMRPRGIEPAPLPNQPLSTPAAPAIDTSQSPNAPFTPEEQAHRHRQKQIDDSATSSITANYGQMLEAGRKAGAAAGGGLGVLATSKVEELPKQGEPGVLTPEFQEKYGQQHPAAIGAGRAVGGLVGQMAADPVTYAFMGSSEVISPVLDKIISTGFRLGLGVHAIDAARDLKKNWDTYTPEQRYEKAVDAGLSGAMAMHAHQVRDFLNRPYEALPAEPNANAKELFRNLIYKSGGGALREEFTEEEGNTAYRAALNKLRDPQNPEHDSPLVKELTAAHAGLKTARGQNLQTEQFNQYSDVPQGYKVLPPAEAKPVHHASNDVDELRESAKRQSENVGDAVAKATEGVKGAKVEAVRDAKDADRITDKAERQGVQPSQVGDIAGAKVTVPHQEAANQVLENLHKEMPVESANGAVTGEPGKNNVRQAQALVDTKAPEGEVVRKAEIMLQTPEMARATDETHADYRKAQELRAQGKETEAAELEKKIAREHESAEKAAQSRGAASMSASTAVPAGRIPVTATENGGRPVEGASGRAARRPLEPANFAPQTPVMRPRLPGQAPIPLTSRRIAGSSRPPEVTPSPGKRPDIGIDFDGTLFTKTPTGEIGEPIPERIASLKQMLAEGKSVIIETRRVKGHPEEIKNVQDALEAVGLPRLPVTDEKVSPVLIDDSAHHVETNQNTPLPQIARGPGQASIPPAVRRANESKTAEGKSAIQPQPVSAESTIAENQPAGVLATGEAPRYKFGSTQVNIAPDSEAAKALAIARARISESDLMPSGMGGNEKGIETEPHATVRYGIKGDDTAGIKRFLSQQAPFEATLGKTTKFPPSEHSGGAAVIIAPIEAPDLHRLNAELEKHGEFTEPSFREYKPHATLAYVKPEKADRYAGMSVTDGKKFTVNQIAITDRSGDQQIVKLEGKKVVERKPGQAPVPPKKDLGDLVIKPIFGGKTETIPTEKLQTSEPKAPKPLEKKPAEPVFKMGDIVEKDGKQYEVGYVNGGSGGSVRLQDPQTNERIPGWHSQSDLTLPRKIEEKPVTESKGAASLANAVYEKLKNGESLGNVTELNKMSEAAFGSSRTSGLWTPKDAFDAMEAGINKYLIDHGKTLMEMEPAKALNKLREIMDRVTSQGVRTEEQIKNQQFSTPPTESYVVAKVAGLKPSDVVLEPSAGNGGLAVWPKAIGAEVHVNEIAPRRQEMLQLAGFGKPSAHDGEIINSLLDPRIKPTVILMNPPFSASTQKSYEAANRNQYGFNHVESALQRLEDGGRLVAILGGGRQGFDEGASLTASGARQWFQKIAQRYNIRANVRVHGKEYQKYGTSFATRIIVIDKDGPTPEAANYGHGRIPESIVNKSVDTLQEAYNALRDVASSRPEAQGGKLAQAEPRRDLEPTPEPSVPSVRPPAERGGRTHEQVSTPVSRPGGSESRPAASRSESGAGELRVPEQESRPEKRDEGEAAGRPRGSAENDHPERQVARGGLDLEEVEAKAHREEEDEKDSAYVTYQPTLKGAKHPGSIVETKAMATVPMPPLTYKPDLPESVIGKGPDYEGAKLSAVQMESVAIAGMQNEIKLPNGARASALIGDGTGVGKGRESAAILWDNWRKGRKRLVWMSKSKDLMQDAIRDLEGLGAKDLAKSIRSLGKLDAKTPIDHQGILYTTYSLFRSGDKKGNTRAAQIDKWLRGNDDGEGGYLLMDESHNLKNAVVAQGQEASQVGEAVKKFLDKMPALRTVSLSATAATDVMNLGYLDRLGLWGPGTPFPGGFPQFAGEISHGGMSAMEMIARELKSQGKYVSRTLTYKGVKYSEIEHEVTEDQKKIYATAAKAWRSIQQSMEATIEHTTNGGARQKALAMAQFYSTQQRFFGLLLSSMKIPTTVAEAKKALAAGKSVAVTLINTNEAAQNREKNRVAAEGESEEEPDYDFGPGRLLKDMVMEHYPTQQYVDDVDANGNSIKVPAVDAEGHPIQNPQAVKERDDLVAKMEKELHMPANPLDELIEQLGGPTKVAELTGRKQRYDPNTNRLVNRGGDGVSQDKINKAEEHAFQSGKKRIAILSSAADTGISLHADKGAANQQQRFVITHQVGWSADKAMQMNGRFNRSNQTSAPEYALLKSDMGGESRFISSIARRMESLEALSKGQTKTNAGTDAMSKVNFETDQGRAATVAFYNQLLRNVDIPGTEDTEGKAMSGSEVLKQLGVLRAQTGGGETVPPRERDNITRLLNRLLALEPNIQNAVYDYFYDIFDAVVKDAIDKGTIDTGVKRIPGDSFEVKEFRPLASDPTTGAKTFYYPVEAQERMERMPAQKFQDMLDKADRQVKNPVVMRHEENGKLLLVVDAKPIIKASGEQIDAVHVMKPSAGTPEKVALSSLYKWKPVDAAARTRLENAERAVASAKAEIEYYKERLKEANTETYKDLYQQRVDRYKEQLTEARKERGIAAGEVADRGYLDQVKDDWQKQYEEAPTHKTKEHHLIGGAVLKYWNPIREAVGGRMEVYSTVDAKTGQRVVGIEIPATQIQKLLRRISGGKSTVTTAQIIPDVLRNATAYDLEAGIKISRGRLARENVVKFTTNDANIQRRLKDLGVIHEIGIQPIYYLPTNESKAGTILDKILKEYPVKQDAEPEKPENLITGESGSRDRSDERGSVTTSGLVELPLAAAKAVADAATHEFTHEIKPALEKTGLTFQKALDELTHLIAPRAGVPTKTLDSMMRLAGERERHRWYLDQVLEESQQMMDKLSKDDQVAFVDRYKQGQNQPTPELTQLAEFMGKTDEETYRQVVETQVANLSKEARKLWDKMPEDDKTAFLHKIADFKGDESLEEGPLKELADALLNYKNDHFRVIWKVVPGTEGKSGAGGVQGKRPLQGSKGFLKQSTLATMSEGVENGGEPLHWNPVRMFQAAQSDAWRYITAQRMWKEAGDMGERIFLPKGKHVPEGFRVVEDKIGNVRFPAASGEGMIEAGRWAMAEPRYRLLENMLSRDWFREHTVPNLLMRAKNQLTAWRLSLSPFHALTTSVSSAAGQAGRGLEDIGGGVLSLEPGRVAKGAIELATFPVAPVRDYLLGTKITRYATNPEEFIKSQAGQDFLEQYPESEQLVSDLFSGGAKLGLHEDERLHAVAGFQQAVVDQRWIAAVFNAPFALNQQIMRPLFGYYIPRLKLASWLRDYSELLVRHADEIDAGKMTRGQLARKTWDATDNIFGQMNWDARWWDRTFKAGIQLAFRAFTWFAGNVRLVKDAGVGQTEEILNSLKYMRSHFTGEEPPAGSAPVPHLDQNLRRIMGLFAVVAATNAAVQYAMTREKPKDIKDLLAARIGGTDSHGHPRRVLVPAIVVKDAISLYSQGAVRYLGGKISDLFSGLYDVFRNEDFRHTMIHNPEDSWWKKRFKDVEHVVGSPIGVSNYQRERQQGATKAGSALGEAGFSPAPAIIDQSKAERVANEIAAENAQDAPITEKQREETDRHHSILTALRNGDDDSLRAAIEGHDITHREAVELKKRSRLSPLADQVNNFRRGHNAEDAYRMARRVYEASTPEEKKQLDPILAQMQRARHLNYWRAAVQ